MQTTYFHVLSVCALCVSLGKQTRSPLMAVLDTFQTKEALFPFQGKFIESNYVVKNDTFPHVPPCPGELIQQCCKGNIDSTRWSLFTCQALYTWIFFMEALISNLAQIHIASVRTCANREDMRKNNF